MRALIYSISIILYLSSISVWAVDRIELDAAIIKADTESPAILYIVPWKDMKQPPDQYQGFVIEDLQQNILTPLVPGRELLVE